MRVLLATASEELSQTFDLLARAPCTLVASMRAGSGSDKSRARTAATAWTAADPTTAPFMWPARTFQLALTDDRASLAVMLVVIFRQGRALPGPGCVHQGVLGPLQPSLVSPTALSTRTRWLRRKIMNPGAVRTGGEHIEYAGASRPQAQKRRSLRSSRRSPRSSRRSPRSSRLSSRRSERRPCPCATTAAVPTTAAVRATGLGPSTPRPLRPLARGISSFSFRGCQLGALVGCIFLLISLDCREQRLGGDAATGHQLTAGTAHRRGKRCGPGVLPH